MYLQDTKVSITRQSIWYTKICCCCRRQVEKTTWWHLSSAVTEEKATGEREKREGKSEEREGKREKEEGRRGKWKQGTGKWQLASRDSIPKCGGCQSKAQQSHSVNRRRRKGLERGAEVKAAAHRNEANPNQNLMRGTNRHGEGEGGVAVAVTAAKSCATFVRLLSVIIDGDLV